MIPDLITSYAQHRASLHRALLQHRSSEKTAESTQTVRCPQHWKHAFWGGEGALAGEAALPVWRRGALAWELPLAGADSKNVLYLNHNDVSASSCHPLMPPKHSHHASRFRNLAPYLSSKLLIIFKMHHPIWRTYQEKGVAQKGPELVCPTSEISHCHDNNKLGLGGVSTHRRSPPQNGIYL